MTRGADLIISAREALSIAEGRRAPAAVLEPIPVDVAAIRKAQNLPQGSVAQRHGLPVGMIRDREQGRRRPDCAACLPLRLIDAKPEVVARVLSASE